MDNGLPPAMGISPVRDLLNNFMKATRPSAVAQKDTPARRPSLQATNRPVGGPFQKTYPSANSRKRRIPFRHSTHPEECTAGSLVAAALSPAKKARGGGSPQFLWQPPESAHGRSRHLKRRHIASLD